MTDKASTAGLVTVSTIARIAKTSPPVVSNWRRRSDDFPVPVAGTGRRSLFDLDQVEAWLLSNDKIDERISPKHRLMAMLDGLGGDWPIEEALDYARAALLYLVACQRSGDRTRRIPVDVPDRDLWATVEGDRDDLLAALSTATERVAQDNPVLDGLLQPLSFDSRDNAFRQSEKLGFLNVIAATLDRGVDPVEVFSELIGFGGASNPKASAAMTTPESLVRLLTSLLPQDVASVFDPATGRGRLLSEVVLRTGATRVVANEIHQGTAVIARSRFFLEDLPVEFNRADTLRMEEWPKVDLLVTDPPFGLRPEADRIDSFSDPRWKFGEIPPRSADFAWIEMGSLAVDAGGMGMVLSPSGSLFRGGLEAEIRASMIEAGVIEAVVQLPQALTPFTAIPTALWLLRSLDSPEPGKPILLIDASALGSGKRPPFELSRDSIDRISAVVTTWRAGDSLSSEQQEIAFELKPDDTQSFELSPSRYLGLPEIDYDSIKSRRDEAKDELRQVLADFHAKETVADLKEIPSDPAWPSKPLGDLAFILRGPVSLARGAEVTSEPGEGSVRLLSRRSLVRNEPEYIKPEDLAREPEKLKEGDVLLFAIPGEVRAWPVDAELADSIFGPGLVAIRVKNPESLRPDWLLEAVRSTDFQAQVGRLVSTQVAPRISPKDLAVLNIPVPPLDRQETIGATLATMDQVLTRSQEVSQLIEEIKGLTSELVMRRDREDDSNLFSSIQSPGRKPDVSETGNQKGES